MRIYMYNTWFGDCFRLDNETSNLFIDFGIHKSCLSRTRKTRDDVHKDISKEIVGLPTKKELLITHFHEDHISGLIYMKNNSKVRKHIFDLVYIPDIWGMSNGTKIISLHLLEELLDHYKLSKRSISLLDFVRFLCSNVKKVMFTKRGSKISGDSYTALWPDPEKVGEFANLILDRIGFENNFYNELLEISKRLCEIVLSFPYGEFDNNGEQNALANTLVEIGSLENTLFELVERYSAYVDELLGYVDERGETPVSFLNDFKNKISIVFHNSQFCDKNVLFTGDLEARYLKKIANNYDGNYEMYDKYHYIKLPHHGTFGHNGEHYFDFKKYQPKVLMIPNGECINPSYMICNDYGSDIISLADVKVYCSNTNWCLNNPAHTYGTCSCTDHEIIFPYLSKEVI